MEAHTGPKGLEAPREFYSADRRLGGCGAFWAETSKQAAHNDRNRGLEPKYLKDGADVDRSYSMPSQAFQDNYDRAFGKGDYAHQS